MLDDDSLSYCNEPEHLDIRAALIVAVPACIVLWTLIIAALVLFA